MRHFCGSGLGIGLLLAAGVIGSAGAVPLSNQAFAAQVRDWRGQLAAADSALGPVALLCNNLPAHRAAEEPQCVALRLHLRAQARAQLPARPAAGGDTLSGCARSALSGLWGSLGALVGGAA